MVLAGLALCLFTPLALLSSCLGLWKNPSNWRTFFPICVYVVFMTAYCYTPSEGSNVDLVRYFQLIESYGMVSLPEAFRFEDEILYARDILFWICGKLRMPHLVPAITTATVYAVAGYITCDCAERYDEARYIGLLLLFQAMMLPLAAIINNVRNVFGFSLIILASYLDIVKKKRGVFTYFCYAAGALMHLSCFIFVFFRVLSRFSKKIFEVVLIVPFVFSSVIFLVNDYSYIFSFGGSFGNSIQTIIRKLYGYLTDTTSAYAVKATTRQSFVMNRLLMMFGVLLALILIYYGIRYRKQLFKDDLRFYAFVGMIAMMTLACNAFAMPNYWRFSAAYYIASGMILVPLLSQFKQLPFAIKTITVISLLLGPFGLFMQYWQSRSYAFFSFEKMLATNYLTVLYEFIRGILTW